MDIEIIAVFGVGGVAEDVIRANLGLLNVQESDHARYECELDGGDDEEEGEGDVEGSFLKHFVSLFQCWVSKLSRYRVLRG